MLADAWRKPPLDIAQIGWLVLTGTTAILAGVLTVGPVGPQMLLVAVALLATGAVVARPALGLTATILVLPFGVYVASFGGFSLFVWLPLLLLASTAVLLSARSPHPPGIVQLPTPAFSSFAAIAALSAFASADLATAGTRLVYLLSFGLAAAALVHLLASGRLSVRVLARIVVASGVLAGTFLIGQFLWALSVGPDAALEGLRALYPLFGGERAANTSLGNWYVPNIGVVRAIVPFMAPPSAGQYMMIAFLAAIWLAITAPRTASRSRMRWVVVAMLGLALICTFSRQAWLGAGVGLVLIGLRGSFRRVAPAAIAAATVFMFVNVPGTDQTLAGHLIEAGNTSDESSAGRLALWGDALHQVSERPLLGIGPGLYSTLNPFGEGAYYAHNIFLDVAVEMGVVGALALVWLLVALMRRAARNSPMLALPALGAYVAANLVDDVSYFPRNGFLLAVIAAIACFGGEGPIHRTAPSHQPGRS